MKFAVGDPVWARSNGSLHPPGEYPGVVLTVTSAVCPNHELPYYGVEVWDNKWAICEHFLRPRRDDYQQYEPRVDLKDQPVENYLFSIAHGGIPDLVETEERDSQ